MTEHGTDRDRERDMSKRSTETGSGFHATGTDGKPATATETGSRETVERMSESRQNLCVALYLMHHNGEPCIA